MQCKTCGTQVSEFPLRCKVCNEPLCDTHSQLNKCTCIKPLVLEKIRRSGLVAYETCPFQFKNIYIDGMGDDETGNVLSLIHI
jgi:hypothetical protein